MKISRKLVNMFVRKMSKMKSIMGLNHSLNKTNRRSKNIMFQCCRLKETDFLVK